MHDSDLAMKTAHMKCILLSLISYKMKMLVKVKISVIAIHQAVLQVFEYATRPLLLNNAKSRSNHSTSKLIHVGLY